jgi:predicted membrane protein
MRPHHCSGKNKVMKKIVFALLVIAAGVLLLAFNLGYLPAEYRHIIFSWQVLLVAIGLINLAGRDNWIVGLVLIFVGGFFIIPKIHVFPFNFEALFWPALLILGGCLFIIAIATRRTWHPGHFNDQKISESGFINESNIFSGNKHKITSQEFKGGKVSNIFGGTELDLTQAKLAPGENILEISCIFGGVSLTVPADWTVRLEVSSIMGGFNDKRNHYNKDTQTSDRELVIKGSAIFGGGDMKDY